jgi:putative hemolysin
MVRNVFRLDDRQIGSLMVPRADVVVLDLQHTTEEHLARIESSGHARFPVVRGSLEQPLGVVNARQWLSSLVRDGGGPLEKQPLESALYVPETVTGMELLDNFRSSDVRMAFVIDEYGQVQGIVTLQDLVEAITGEFQPRDPAASWAVRREDGCWLLDGHIPVPELKDTLVLAGVPDEDRGRYHTLSGMLMLLTGRLPRAGDVTVWEDWELEVVALSGKTIDRVLARPRGTTAGTALSGSASAAGSTPMPD